MLRFLGSTAQSLQGTQRGLQHPNGRSLKVLSRLRLTSKLNVSYDTRTFELFTTARMD